MTTVILPELVCSALQLIKIYHVRGLNLFSQDACMMAVLRCAAHRPCVGSTDFTHRPPAVYAGTGIVLNLSLRHRGDVAALRLALLDSSPPRMPPPGHARANVSAHDR